jgi:hypothetical protein
MVYAFIFPFFACFFSPYFLHTTRDGILFDTGPFVPGSVDYNGVNGPGGRKTIVEYGEATCDKKECIDRVFNQASTGNPPYTAFPKFPAFTGINCNVLTSAILHECTIGAGGFPNPGRFPAPGWWRG